MSNTLETVRSDRTARPQPPKLTPAARCRRAGYGELPPSRATRIHYSLPRAFTPLSITRFQAPNLPPGSGPGPINLPVTSRPTFPSRRLHATVLPPNSQLPARSRVLSPLDLRRSHPTDAAPSGRTGNLAMAAASSATSVHDFTVKVSPAVLSSPSLSVFFFHTLLDPLLGLLPTPG